MKSLPVHAVFSIISLLATADSIGYTQTPTAPRDPLAGLKVNCRDFEYANGTKWHAITVIQFQSIQKDLGLTREQTAAVNDQLDAVSQSLASRAVKDRPMPVQPSRDEALSARIHAVEKAIAEHEPRIRELLDKRQQSRLDQIVIQAQQGNALLRQEIADKLGLTADQKRQLTMILEDYNAAVSDETKSPLTKVSMRTARNRKLQELASAKNASLLSVLTEQQSKDLAMLKGTDIDLATFITADRLIDPAQ